MPRPDDHDEKDPSFIEMPLEGNHPADVFVTWEELRGKLVELEKQILRRIEAQLDDYKARQADEQDESQ